MNKSIYAALTCLTLVSTQVFAKIIPDWVTSTPAGQSVYCVPAGSNIDMARKVALQFASEDQDRGVIKVDVSGSEYAKTVEHNGSTVSNYTMSAETISTGMKQTVLLIEEALVDESLCILVQ